MPLNVGSLYIELAANVARIQADMDATKKAVYGAMKDVEQYVGLAKTAFITLGGVTSINQFAGVIDGAIQAKVRLYDLSLQTGISVEALSGLRSVAKYSATDLNDVAAASNKLSKALNTQNEDSKGAAQVVKALGLDFQQFKALRPETQLLEIAKAFDKFQDDGGKAAGAMLLFGKQGAQLLPFLKEFAERQTIVGKETTESAKRAKEFEDKVTALQTASKQWVNEVVNTFLPTLDNIAGGFLDARKQADEFNLTGAVIKTTFEAVTIFGANVSFVLQAVGREIGAIAAQGAALARGDFAGFSAISEAVKADGVRARAELDAFEDRVRGFQDRIGPSRGLVDLTARRKSKLGDFNDDDEGRKKKDEFASLLKDINERIAAEKAELDQAAELTAAQRLQAKVYEDIDSGVIKLTLDQKLEADARLQVLLGIEKENAARKALEKQVEEDRRETNAYIESQEQLRDSLTQQRKSLEDQLAVYGLNRDEVDALRASQLRQSAAQIQAKKNVEDFSPVQRALNKLYEDQAQQLLVSADLLDTIRERRERDSRDPLAGAQRGVRNYLDEIRRAGDFTQAAVGDSLRSLEDGLVNFITKGKFGFQQFADAVIQDLVRIQVRAALTKVFGDGSGLGDIIGAVFGGGSKGTGTNGGGGFSAPGGTAPLALGGAFDGGVRPFAAGGVFDTPTLFRFASGGQFRTGLMGEAGPEAVMPLRRGSDGRLGVQAPAPVVNVEGPSVVVNNHGSGVQAQARSRTNAAGRQELEILITDIVAADFAGGQGRITRAAAARLGGNPAAGAPRLGVPG